MRGKTRVAIDFDGVIADYDGDWTKEQSPLPGAWAFVIGLVHEGYEVCILTARTDFQQVNEWLMKYGFPLSHDCYCTNVKPPAAVYIDDRGFRFTGDWGAAKAAVHAKTWWSDKEGAYEGWTRDGQIPKSSG